MVLVVNQATHTHLGVIRFLLSVSPCGVFSETFPVFIHVSDAMYH